jgi:hypothetical protein
VPLVCHLQRTLRFERDAAQVELDCERFAVDRFRESAMKPAMDFHRSAYDPERFDIRLSVVGRRAEKQETWGL